MDFELFESAGLLLMHRHHRYSLFAMQTLKSQIDLKPLPFAQDLSTIKVDTDCRLIITPSGVYDFQGNYLRAFSGKRVCITKLAKSVLVASAPQDTDLTDEEIELFLWKNEKFLLQTTCHRYKTSNKWLATCGKTHWSFYSQSGRKVNMERNIPSTDDIGIYNNLIIQKSAGNYSLHSLKTGKLLREKQLIVVGSHYREFAICCTLSKQETEVYYKGVWTTYKDVDKCRIVDDQHGLFFIRQKGKYFLYNFDGTPFMHDIFPDGIDFVGYNDEQNTLMLMEKGHPNFFAFKA